MTDELIEDQTEVRAEAQPAMPKTYKFLGQESEIHGYAKLNRFGQSVQLPEEIFRDAVVGGCSLLPADEFDALFGSAEPTNDKRREGWVRVEQYRTQFSGGDD